MPVVHVLGNLILFGLFIAIGVWLSRSKRGAVIGVGLSGLVALLSVVLAVRPGWAVTVLPYENLTYYDNVYPLAFGLFAPCVWAFINTFGQGVRMVFWCGLLFVLSLFPFRYHIAPLSHSGGTSIDADGVCRQSDDYNCSAAALVTMLRMYGVDCTEAEAIVLAGTKDGQGTEALGLYRALRHFDDEVQGSARINHFEADELLTHPGPAIILVGLPSRGRAHNAAAYGRQNNWVANFYHDVVYLGIDPDDPQRVLIADPDMGIESWRQSDLRFLYRGQAVMYE